MRLVEIVGSVVANLEAEGVQPTVRQVSRAMGLTPDGAAKPLLRVAIEAGAVVKVREWIEAARGEFDVYRSRP